VVVLARSPLSHRPPKRSPSEKGNEGTPAPIPPSFHYFDYLGKLVQEAADWLNNESEGLDLDAHLFALVDRSSEEDGTVVLCRIGGGDGEGISLTFSAFRRRRLRCIWLRWMQSSGRIGLIGGSGTAVLEY